MPSGLPYFGEGVCGCRPDVFVFFLIVQKGFESVKRALGFGADRCQSRCSVDYGSSCTVLDNFRECSASETRVGEQKLVPKTTIPNDAVCALDGELTLRGVLAITCCDEIRAAGLCLTFGSGA